MDYPRKEWLLCFDFDGTLIDPKKSQEIDPSLQKALSLIREKKAACINPVAKELKVPKGEISYNSLILIVPIFLNFGAGLFVRSIGTNANDNKTETKINGS